MNPHATKRNPTVTVEGLWDTPPASQSLTLGEAHRSYLSSFVGRDRSAPQRSQFWVDTIGPSTPLSRVGKIHVQRVLKALSVQGPTKNRYCSALSSLYAHAETYLHWEGDNPATGWRKWPENSCSQTALSPEDIQKLLAACLLSSWPKLRLLVLMAIVTGLRRGNVSWLRYEDVDESGRMKVGRTKNGTPFVAVMTRELAAEFARFPGAPQDLIFASPRRTDRPFCFDRQYKAALARAGLPRAVNIHTLRHTCASILAAHGASTIEIMEFMNHKTPAMAARYSHLSVTHRQKRAEELLGSLGLPTATPRPPRP
jgi:integrase